MSNYEHLIYEQRGPVTIPTAAPALPPSRPDSGARYEVGDYLAGGLNS